MIIHIPKIVWRLWGLTFKSFSFLINGISVSWEMSTYETYESHFDGRDDWRPTSNSIQYSCQINFISLLYHQKPTKYLAQMFVERICYAASVNIKKRSSLIIHIRKIIKINKPQVFINRWVDKNITYTFYMCNGILLSHKKNGILSFAATWMNLEGIILNKMSEKDKYCMISLICGI